MGAAAEKKPDLALIFGGPKKPPVAGDEPDGDEGAPPMPDDKGGDEPSEAFKTALNETGLQLDDEQGAALWRAIKECTGSY